MADQYSLISTWTRFKVSLDESILDIDDGSNAGKRWIEIVRPLVKASGHMKSYWGRVKEDTAEVMLVSIWRNPSSLADFKASPGYGTYILGISTSGQPPAELTVDFGNTFWYNKLGCQTAVTTVYFASPPTALQRAKIDNMRGLHYSYGFGFSNQHRYLSRSVPARGWVEERQQWGEKQLTTMIWCHFWKGAEEEKRFKENEVIALVRGNVMGETVKVLELWERELEEVGAIGWTEEHCDFTTVPRAFRGEPWGG